MGKRIWILLAAAVLLIGLSGCRKEITDPAAYLGEIGPDCGYANALSELSEVKNTQLEDAGFLRLQQNYRGIPVYGRTVVYVTDENGEPFTVTGNAMDVDETLNLTPSFSPADAMALLASQREGAVPEIGEDALCIYNLGSDGASHLAYRVNLGGYEILLDAHSGQVLAENITIQEESATGYAQSDSTQDAGVPVRKESDGVYVLADDSRRMTVFTLSGIPLSVSVDQNGKKETTYHCHDGSALEIVSTDNIFGNTEEERKLEYEKGVTLLYLTGAIHDYYLEELSYKSNYDIHLYYNDGYYEGKNGLGGFCDHDYGIISIGYLQSPGRVDLVAHEYTHVVSRDIVCWASRGETGAINEAISDIYGEIIEDSLTGHPIDWCNSDRNLQSPAATGNPSLYFGPFWGDPTDVSTDNGNIHKNSTVISHAAYLMSESGGGLLTLEELANLWYRAMLMMPSTCTFPECRERLEWAALTMDLPEEKLSCISKAFDAVNIPSARIVLAPQGKLTVLDRLWMPYDNYSISIRYYDVANPEDSLLPPNDVALKLLKTEEVTSAEPYIMDLRPGFYVVELTDGADSRKKVDFELFISPNGPGEKTIDTNFGGNQLWLDIHCLNTVLEGATVTMEIAGEQVSAVTDEFGTCTFDLPDHPVEILLTARKEGYGQVRTVLSLTEDELLQPTISRSITLSPPYGEIIARYEADWGTARWLDFGWGYYYGAGVFYLDLLDFDADGIDELVMGYGKGGTDYSDQIIEIWTMENGAPKMVHRDVAMHGSDISRWFRLLEMDGKWYVGSGYAGYETDITYYGLSGGSMYPAVSFSLTHDGSGQSSYVANGLPITSANYGAYFSLWETGGITLDCLRSGGWIDIQACTDEIRTIYGLPPIS